MPSGVYESTQYKHAYYIASLRAKADWRMSGSGLQGIAGNRVIGAINTA
jgi:hypothetical protein